MKSEATAVTLILLLGALAAGCSKSDTAPTSSTPTTLTEIIVGTLEVRGSNLYGFNVTTAGTVTVTLASVTAGALGLPTGAAVGVGLGTVISETECTVTSSTNLTAALTPQISTSMTTGPKCVQVSDPGTLTDPVNFAIRLVHP
jgi:hypothetical protein